jgi:hypothetical protein
MSSSVLVSAKTMTVDKYLNALGTAGLQEGLKYDISQPHAKS